MADSYTEVEQNVHSATLDVVASVENYDNLKALAKTAVIEFDDLKLKCKEYFKKYKNERERYLKVKADLDQLKNISSIALEEYEYLQRKFHVEQECRDKAVEIATKAVDQNKQLKRQSQMIMTHIADLNSEEINLNALKDLDVSNESDSDSIVIQLQDEIKDLKENIEKFKSELQTAKRELQISQEGFKQEKNAHAVTRKKLISCDKKLKQLNRVSVMAFEEFNVLQTKFEVETQCRAEAEKIAAEAKRADEDLKRKSLILKETASQDERLTKAFEEISKLNKQLDEERAIKDQKVKELTEELTLSKDGEYLIALKDKLDVAQEEIENLESQVTEAQNNAKEAEEKIKSLEQKLDDLEKASLPPPPPPPPLAPPPPPPPSTVVKKFMNIMGKKKKGVGLKRQKQLPDDPLSNAMKEMIDRINNGKVQLKPVGARSQRSSAGSEEDDSAMSELGSLLTSLRKSPSFENLLEKSPTKSTGETCEWSKVKLRKWSEQGLEITKSLGSTSDSSTVPFSTNTLRKTRSYSTNDIFNPSYEVKNEATSELRKILEKKKVEAERDSTIEVKDAPKEADNKEMAENALEIKEYTNEEDKDP